MSNTINVFVSYNTDSIVKLSFSKKYSKKIFNKQKRDYAEFKKQFLNWRINAGNKFSQQIDNETSQQKTEKFILNTRIDVFKRINELSVGQKTAKMPFTYYFDILDAKNNSPKMNDHIENNKSEICRSDVFLFVVAKTETSFWQLQELFFASYYDKTIITLSADKYIRLLTNKMLNKYLFRMLNKKHRCRDNP